MTVREEFLALLRDRVAFQLPVVEAALQAAIFDGDDEQAAKRRAERRRLLELPDLLTAEDRPELVAQWPQEAGALPDWLADPESQPPRGEDASVECAPEPEELEPTLEQQILERRAGKAVAEDAARAAAAQVAQRRIVVPRLHLKLELASRDLLAEVDARVGQAGEVAQIYWREAASIESDHPLVLQIAAALRLADGELREIFEAAARRDA